MKIAVLYTCFNRKEKTLSSLKGLYESVRIYNQQAKGEHISPVVYLTDDGCTDGTADAIRESFPDREIHILQGTGSMFWAGGMRFAWREALKRHKDWEFYLLLNDDTDIFGFCLKDLLVTHDYCMSNFKTPGIYSGITCSKSDMNTTTYGGTVFSNRFLGKGHQVQISKQPQLVHTTNANILLVPKSVVDTIGIFYDSYQHSLADFDYSMTARRKGIPVLVTASYCGACDRDHPNAEERKQKIINMTPAERKAYFEHPLHSSKDYLTFIRRNIPLKYPFTWFLRMLNEKFPALYFKLNHGQ